MTFKSEYNEILKAHIVTVHHPIVVRWVTINNGDNSRRTIPAVVVNIFAPFEILLQDNRTKLGLAFSMN